MKVLHITPHLGGGVGKALSAITGSLPPGVADQTFVLLEKPINQRYSDIIKASGSTVLVADNLDHVARLAAKADIVQFEFINHPRIFECLARTDFPAMRSLIWAHVSGLFKPFIHPGLIKQAQRFVFTSDVSRRSPTMVYLNEDEKRKISVINSGFGFDENVVHLQVNRKVPIISYLGTVNFVKMNPCFFDAIDLLKDDVRAVIWGIVDQHVVDYANTKKHPNRFHFLGETDYPAAALAGTDIFFYPLQPTHYGTGENALVEAMSLGLATVVMSNPAELEIIKHRDTGFVANTTADCVKYLNYLLHHQVLRDGVTKRAIEHVNKTRTAGHAAIDFIILWNEMMKLPAKQHDFKEFIGNSPAEWFMTTQGLPGTVLATVRADQDQSPTKGNLAHFEKVFAGDESLAQLG